MADRMFPKAKKRFFDAQIALLTDTIKLFLMLDTYTYDNTDEFVADLSAQIATDGRSAALTSKTTTNGVFDAADVVFSTVTASQTIGSLVLVKDTGDDNTAPVIAFFDSYNGLPLSTNGGDVNVTFDAGANKIMALTDV